MKNGAEAYTDGTDHEGKTDGDAGDMRHHQAEAVSEP